MKKILSIVMLLALSIGMYAQEKLVLKSGTLITVENKEEVRAKNVNASDLLPFYVAEDVRIGDSVVISAGNKVFARVLVAKKSGIAGTKGKLKIEWVYCEANSGTKIPLEGEIDFSRKNHTAGAVAAAAVVAAPLIFLTGQHAAIPEGYKDVVSVKADTEL
ncbi:MAG: hypothetical protein IJV27_00350 [Prevotella sp.]|nr:hypothetical protein [Prevotella sp.]